MLGDPPEYAPAAITNESASYRPSVASTARTDPPVMSKPVTDVLLANVMPWSRTSRSDPRKRLGAKMALMFYMEDAVDAV